LSKIVVSCENYQKYLIMMFNILSFFNVRNVKNYINSNNNNKLENKYISDYHCSLYKIQYIINIDWTHQLKNSIK
jgi:hypothetical protein